MKLLRVIILASCLWIQAVYGTEIGATGLTIEKFLFISSNYAVLSEQGEIWAKLNRSISQIHFGCASSMSDSGYIVVVFPNDRFSKEYLSGLLTAKATGKTIRIGVDDSRKNQRGMCFMSYYETDS